jgi:acyl transferase domain-containing protein
MDDVRQDGANSGIAIVGMAGRFPGASDVDQFWENIKNGVESISFFSDEELELDEEAASVSARANFVKAKAILDDVELFDAHFFGFNPREAELLDPQHRLFLECCWHALEHAGYDSQRYSGRVGVYGGASTNTYLLNIYSNRALLESIDPFQLLISSDKDFLTTRVSYKLGLSGPSIAVQTACSTSLVAVHLACQSLLNGECDMALAGGVSVTLPQKAGYLYQEGSFLSPDGHCRAFDVEARGTVSGNGAGVVVLKRHEDALADGDSIYAVIKGSAVNNDAAMKAGYTAPSVTAQATVVAEALAVAGIEPDTVSYLETHGTATPLGDPVEVGALTKAFRLSTERTGYCAIGSVKTNIGHLDAAAGVASLIKVIMALINKTLPPSLHFKRANPQLKLESSPFYVNTTSTRWEPRDWPRRAGVSSFGIGGTNAHVALEEATEQSASGPARAFHVLTLSAKTMTALDRMTSDLVEYLDRHEDVSLADVAYVLNCGRREFENRRVAVCSSAADAKEALTEQSRVLTRERVQTNAPVVFMFPGQGSQYINMGRQLYETEETFRAAFDRCSETLQPLMGVDLVRTVYPPNGLGAGELDRASKALEQTAVAQASLFAVEYAAAALLMDWGVKPSAMVGHSIGEYVAACLAGVFSLEDALKLVAVRGSLMGQVAPGRMLAVALGEDEARNLIGERLSIAVVNGRSLVVISGPPDDIEELQAALSDRNVKCNLLHTSHAFHSAMMTPILGEFEEKVRSVNLNQPAIRFVSNVTGDWVTAEQATDPHYWSRHLRETVRFSDGLELLANGSGGVFLEVGPGTTLSTLAKRLIKDRASWTAVSTQSSYQSRRSDIKTLLESLGMLWLSGVPVNWSRFYRGQHRRRIALPGYPFERRRYWIDYVSSGRQPRPADLHVPAPVAPPAHQRPSAIGSEYAGPTNETEAALAEIWQAVFGIDRIGIDDEFFGLGGHSLLATQLIAEVRDWFAIDLPLQKFFESPTIAGLALAVEESLIQKIDRMSEEEVESLLT